MAKLSGKLFHLKTPKQNRTVRAFPLLYCFTLAALQQLPKASPSFLGFKPLSALADSSDNLESRGTSYIPFRSLPKEKFKRLVPYLYYEDDDQLGALTTQPLEVPRRYPPPMGRLEKAFFLIGGTFAAGFAGGGAYGIAEGITSTRDFRGNVRVTQIFNHFLKRGKSMSNILGAVALLYCSTGVLLQLARGGKDDAWNTIAAGGCTGLMIKSSIGRSLNGGIGLILSSVHVLIEHLKKVVLG
ncbi:mitochondrial import inner membrane translocase subunit Tim23-like [Armigeres subalbatus]|uniref:mitochondrial import inner membrane translocase subunit Tim23-like n=1 Tax=Armigeres subalbatus TaxID=124917 RepID=UPI002ED10592